MMMMMMMVMRTTMTLSCVARLLYTPAATLVSAPTRHSVIRGGPPTETSRAIICISPLCQTVFLLSAKLYFSAALKPISLVLSSQTIVLSTRRNKTALVRKEKGFLCNLHLDSTNSVSCLSESDQKTKSTKRKKEKTKQVQNKANVLGLGLS